MRIKDPIRSWHIVIKSHENVYNNNTNFSLNSLTEYIANMSVRSLTQYINQPGTHRDAR